MRSSSFVFFILLKWVTNLHKPSLPQLQASFSYLFPVRQRSAFTAEDMTNSTRIALQRAGVSFITESIAEIHNRMRFAAAQVFHACTAFYLLTMDVLYALKLIEVLTVRTDLLWAHYRGLGLQFFTVWSQIAQQSYFFLALGYDVIEPRNDAIIKHLKKYLRILKAVCFTSVVVPTAVVLQDYVPSWMDHSLHTSVLLFTLAELLLSHRPYPRWSTLGRMRSTVVVLAYTSWVTLAVLLGSAWPYPYMRLMSVTQRLGYVVANCALAVWSYHLGEMINTAFWGKKAQNRVK
ncbi:Androgen-induced protein 1 [Zootermopsis nevadensis]|uniref:Androgen-induced protein 1 n=1 Tax=Zootermopsis nevadensis TaxID=136037 RepID=A0A067QSV9_ZOONE|nr:Androgen-induced protein 1 [Zootermopsis nevadensis]